MDCFFFLGAAVASTEEEEEEEEEEVEEVEEVEEESLSCANFWAAAARLGWEEPVRSGGRIGGKWMDNGHVPSVLRGALNCHPTCAPHFLQ